MSRDRIALLIADDHTLLREALTELLRAEGEIVIVAEACNAEDTITVAGRTHPDVVLLHDEMAGRTTVQLIRGLRAHSPGTKVVVLTTHDDDPHAKDLLAAGASCLIHTKDQREELLTAIRGEAAGAGGRPATAAPLSPREVEVLGLAAMALSNRQIAKRLSIRDTTVKRHLRNIFRKLGAVSRVDAVIRALAASLIDAPWDRTGASSVVADHEAADIPVQAHRGDQADLGSGVPGRPPPGQQGRHPESRAGAESFADDVRGTDLTDGPAVQGCFHRSALQPPGDA